MKYRNTKTGAVIELGSILSGGDWEAVSVKSAESATDTAPKEKKKRTK